MREKILNSLICPSCGGTLDLKCVRDDGSEVIDGSLLCANCREEFSVINGIPRMSLNNLSQDKRDTAKKFGYEWKQFSMLTDHYKAQFLDWIKPIRQDFFRNKVILDAGCGKGRHTYWAAKFGAKEIFAVDLSEAVEQARKNTGEYSPNVYVIQSDIYSLPFRKNFFDYIYSIGVLHHLPDPKKGFSTLVNHLAPGGTISAWVYGKEDNEWIINIINPIRENITSRLPENVVRLISFLLACFLVPISKIIYFPVNEIQQLKFLKKFLFYNDYIFDISKFSFQEIHSIIFDHLVAPTAFYISQEEFKSWFEENNLCNIEISRRNNNSWRGKGDKVI